MDAAAAPDLIKAANLFGTRPRFIRSDLTAKAIGDDGALHPEESSALRPGSLR
jgi:hypothetical protein